MNHGHFAAFFCFGPCWHSVIKPGCQELLCFRWVPFISCPLKCRKYLSASDCHHQSRHDLADLPYYPISWEFHPSCRQNHRNNSTSVYSTQLRSLLRVVELASPSPWWGRLPWGLHTWTLWFSHTGLSECWRPKLKKIWSKPAQISKYKFTWALLIMDGLR